MFRPFLDSLRRHGVPVSLREYLDLLGGMAAGVTGQNTEDFYHFARLSLVKDERHLDRFDRAFAEAFAGLEQVPVEALLDQAELPREWLEKLAEKLLTEAEKAEIAASGSFEALMEKLRARLAEQQGRHQGGSKWIGTGGTSPFGANGYNPEGVRIGQNESRHRRAAKVWDKREFRDFDDSVELGTRNIKVALKRLRQWARHGAAEELDLPATIRATADHGYIDVQTRPERRNAVKVLLFLDVGGSMDDHIRVVDELFSAARAEFKHMEHFFFHNCLYEAVWKDSRRRWTETTPTWDILHRYGRDYKCIFVGDASMSPYEIAVPGGANEHWNPEPGELWLRRATETWPDHVWLNPVARQHWRHTQSIGMIGTVFENRMMPLTLEGLTQAMRILG
ncbi:MAG TPA: VWA domain-containing protein [Paracoccus sp. (in: a-proteobacteria)]|uniref:vWA domain-containing protein n=1 Tax=uncultured Paracoccus sp. TaxID=189685 RepID=UPI0026064F6B|nr:VWA domain-containing protein [uncultured Paracoccus sp.]HMQ42259.1 VWA domain-containing protein [Paracoccus sp. (in: a-proteobacteria)]HMR37632.1 VWA domain-containing protein [Paracoccus sp. (in: a-proteobacteria)]